MYYKDHIWYSPVPIVIPLLASSMLGIFYEDFVFTLHARHHFKYLEGLT